MNRKNKGANTNIIQICVDFLVLLIVFIIERKVFGSDLSTDLYSKCLALVVVFGVIYILSNKEARLYNVMLFFYLDRFWRGITRSWFFASVTTIVLMYVYNPPEAIRTFHLRYIILSYVAICLSMVISRVVQISFSSKKAPRAAFVGNFDEYEKFNYFLNKTSVKLEEVGYILEKEMPEKKAFNVLGTLDEIEQVIRKQEIDQVFFIQHAQDNISGIQKYIDVCLEMGVTVRIVMDVSFSQKMNRSSSFVSSVGTYPVLTYHTIALNTCEKFIKRLMDIVLGVLAILLMSPAFIYKFISIRLRTGKRALVKTKMIGLNGRPFMMYGFSTTGANDKRWRNELPQLINVLRGEMSLVGTRPATEDEVSAYCRSQWRRISIKPGITGLWRIAERYRTVEAQEKLEMDLRYIDDWSIWTDISIMLQTIRGIAASLVAFLT